ncbi:hypothetical protein BOTBODRAFT_50594 [Botryobasidium botryosum FD-172 SS1]|uniref:Histidine kinase/HSP90-like ATPase domain-containing protein n=1 Tax=Botryobasidium botryosum (strain FD-172 SS1) TaxID=930990 RepID=A0A067MXL6_BOTB1|nr:hypothetical protein BOTBODRAFT_50594 [Botryobasidium botryosum FD-172 SS1]
MRLTLRLALLSLLSSALAQDAPGATTQKHEFQSDVARLRNIVINSLYSHRDVFLRELISNANDALEKLRITSLTDKTVLNDPLNITIKLIPDEHGGRVVITDYGIGMGPEELSTNLGTLAKSGTSDFLKKAEGDAPGDTSSLIGQFGLGFYSSFLVSDKVYVASIPHPSKANPNPTQHVFSSVSDEASFEIYPDPRGNTIGRGTEITLVLKEDAKDYLDEAKIRALVEKHSAFSTSYPIYLFTRKTEEIPDPDYVPTEEEQIEFTDAEEEEESKDEVNIKVDVDEDEAVVEDVTETKEAPEEEKKKPVIPLKNVTTEEWVQLNDQPPLWTRDSKNVTQEEYDLFYRATFKDHNNPLALHQFKGDSGSGESFKALFFIPPALGPEFWQSPKPDTKGIRLMVKRVFITDDLGDDALPKWVSWLRAVVDADDLPLNVSRETLQSTRFLRQIKQVLIRRLISLLTRIAEEEPEKFKKITETYGPALKLGAMEGGKDQKKLAALARWDTNTRKFIGLEEYVASRKKGQTQIFYLAAVGKKPEELSGSVFVEKLHARGYEVLLLTDPMDEILVAQLKSWKGLTFQDAAKKGLKFGDEDTNPEDEKAEEARLEEKFKPLLTWLKEEAKDTVLDVVISNRLVTSPCAIVSDTYGYSANMEKLMASQVSKGVRGTDFMHDWAKKQKFLEINPRSPLIEGLLTRVIEMNDDKDEEDERELKEAASILIDGALVRSGFEVPDSNLFFTRMDRVLRRSLGVSQSAKASDSVKPAPPVEDTPLPESPAKEVSLDEDEKLPTESEEAEALFGDFPDIPGKVRIDADDFLKQYDRSEYVQKREAEEEAKQKEHEHDEL